MNKINHHSNKTTKHHINAQQKSQQRRRRNWVVKLRIDKLTSSEKILNHALEFKLFLYSAFTEFNIMSKLSACPRGIALYFFSFLTFLLKQQRNAYSEESYFLLFCHLYLWACATTQWFAICSKHLNLQLQRGENQTQSLLNKEHLLLF